MCMRTRCLQGKQRIKLQVQRELGLPADLNRPLVAFIGRLDYQKGPDIVLESLEKLINLDCQVGGWGPEMQSTCISTPRSFTCPFRVVNLHDVAELMHLNLMIHVWSYCMECPY